MASSTHKSKIPLRVMETSSTLTTQTLGTTRGKSPVPPDSPPGTQGEAQIDSVGTKGMQSRFRLLRRTISVNMRGMSFRQALPAILVIILLVILISRLLEDQGPRDPIADYPRPLHNDSNIALILEAALRIRERPVLITLVNDGYHDMVYSWICNTKHMDFHKQIIIITTNNDATNRIRQLSPDVQVVVIDVEDSMKGHQEYSHVGYVKIMVLRTAIQLALLQYNIEVYTFECDSVFLKNPVPTLQSHSDSYDIVFISNYQRPKAINGGFLYLFPTDATKATFTQLNRQMRELYDRIKHDSSDKLIPTSQNDQVYLSNLVLEKYAGLRSTVIPFSVFPDGKWYDITEEERKLTSPFLIHNNWIKGNQAKMDRAKRWGHWFLKEDKTCDEENIRKVVQS